MNKPEPAGLTVGRELDAEVAEAIGWIPRVPEYKLAYPFWYPPGADTSDIFACIALPPFSTDDGVAFTQVWPWIESQSLSCWMQYFERWPNERPNKAPHRKVELAFNGGPNHSFDGETWAEAICSAAIFIHESEEQR